MAVLEAAGCAMLAFGCPLALFLFTIARDPLRVILFVAGFGETFKMHDTMRVSFGSYQLGFKEAKEITFSAFFWLLALLLSSLWWFAVVPMKTFPAFGLFFSAAFQELFRYFVFLIVHKAEKGLEKVSDDGLHVEGVHSLKNAKHTIAYGYLTSFFHSILICGLGFGTIAGAFSLVNVLADSIGPGTPGFVASADESKRSLYHGNYLFFVTSALYGSAMILLHVAWNVIFWQSCLTKKILPILAVLSSHFLVSGLSILNKQRLYYVSIPLVYVVLVCMSVWAASTAAAGNETPNLERNVRSPQTLSSAASARTATASNRFDSSSAVASDDSSRQAPFHGITAVSDLPSASAASDASSQNISKSQSTPGGQSALDQAARQRRNVSHSRTAEPIRVNL